MTWRVVVVDDHAEFRVSASELVRRAGWDVVATAGDAPGAIQAVHLYRPDLVLLDIGLAPGGRDGIDVAHELAALETPPHVVLISARSAGSYGRRLAEAPVSGFVTKPHLTSRLLAELIG